MMRHWWAPATIVLAGLGLGALLAGRLVPPLTGFIIFALAGATGLVLGFGLGGLGLYRLARGRTQARRTLATAAGPLAIGLAVLASLLSTPGATYNDVTTDLADPAGFPRRPGDRSPLPRRVARLAPADLPRAFAGPTSDLGRCDLRQGEGARRGERLDGHRRGSQQRVDPSAGADLDLWL